MNSRDYERINYINRLILDGYSRPEAMYEWFVNKCDMSQKLAKSAVNFIEGRKCLQD